MKIVTGHTGTLHVTSDDDRALHAGIMGKGSYVLDTGTKLAYTIESSNTIRIASGDIVHNGTHARIPYGEYTDVTIDNGTSGFKRIDLIVARYRKQAGIESVELEVIKGAPSVNAPGQPDYTTGNILNGADEVDMPLYAVQLNGVNIESVTPLFTILLSMKAANEKNLETEKTLKDYVDQKSQQLQSSIQNSNTQIGTLQQSVSGLEQTVSSDEDKRKYNNKILQNAFDTLSDIFDEIATKINDTDLKNSVSATMRNLKQDIGNLQ